LALVATIAGLFLFSVFQPGCTSSNTSKEAESEEAAEEREAEEAREMAEAEKARARAEYFARESAIEEANRRQREALEAEEIERRLQRERDRRLITPWIKAGR
jgi:hypothetical protein